MQTGRSQKIHPRITEGRHGMKYRETDSFEQSVFRHKSNCHTQGSDSFYQKCSLYNIDQHLYKTTHGLHTESILNQHSCAKGNSFLQKYHQICCTDKNANTSNLNQNQQYRFSEYGKLRSRYYRSQTCHTDTGARSKQCIHKIQPSAIRIRNRQRQ